MLILCWVEIDRYLEVFHVESNLSPQIASRQDKRTKTRSMHEQCVYWQADALLAKGRTIIVQSEVENDWLALYGSGYSLQCLSPIVTCFVSQQLSWREHMCKNCSYTVHLDGIFLLICEEIQQNNHCIIVEVTHPHSSLLIWQKIVVPSTWPVISLIHGFVALFYKVLL